jgi:hypothetical protein
MDEPILDRPRLQQAVQLESPITDEQRVWALMALAGRAEEGDEDARARPKAVEQLFARSNRPEKL